MTKSTLVVARPLARVCALLALLTLTVAGCLKREDPNSYANKMKGQQDAVAAFQGMGAKLTEKQYPPYGRGWSVNLSGKQISDAVFDRLKKLGNITELDLSKTNITDAQMARINETEIGAVMLKLDLSNTAVTDAGLEKLTNLMFLSNLNLTGSKATPAGVERFKKNRASDPKFMAQFKSPKIRL